ncbi:MAG: ABC transporter substrate-binding protein [Alphaproteobacteria bacterium]|nr:ABC transporter substrate-binding protein [Alphaproteobacteria bacterium]
MTTGILRPSRRAVLLGLAGTATAAGTGFAQRIAPPPTSPVTISFYNYNLATANIGAEATRELIAEFMAANPNIRVEGVPVASDQIAARVQADVVAGRIPDLAQIVFSDLDFIVSNFGVRPLEDLIPQDEWAAHTQGMVPAGLRLGMLNGRTYGLAYVFSTPVLFYNANLFRAAGLDPDAPPRTWAEVRTAALRIREATGKHGVYAEIFSSFDWLYQALVLSAGGRVLSEDRRRLTFGEPEAVAAVAMMRDLVRSGAHPRLNPAEVSDTMYSGNLGMLLTTSVYQRALLAAASGRFEVRAAAMPAFDERPARPTNSGSALVIMSRDPAKQRAAWELMKFATSRRGYTIITSKIGYLPLRLDIVDDPRYLGDWTRQNPLIRPNLAQLERLEPWQSLPGPNYRQIGRIETGALNEAVFGEGDPARVLREAQQRAQALMPR